MNLTSPFFSAALPEIFMLSMISVIILFDVLLRKKITYYLTQITLLISFGLVVRQYIIYPQIILTFSDQYILDKLALLTKLLILVTSFFAFVYAREYLKNRPIASSEYYILGLLAILGMLIMASAYSFLTIYLGFELLSLSLYAMVALRKDVMIATEAAMKYFVMGALASGLLLYGISMIYGITGSLTIPAINHSLLLPAHMPGHITAPILFALIFIIVGLLFKLGAVPFHSWVPDVYTGAPTSVTLFIASAPKIAAFCITMRILVEAFGVLSSTWVSLLIAIAILSMFIGNLLAIAQTNIKRMLAYSSIAHVGYVLLGIISGPNSSQGDSAAMFYMVTYVIIAAGAFAVIGLLGKQGVDLDNLEDYRGLNARSPWMAFIMLLLMFSMAGVPPTVGFFAKLGLLEALVASHHVWLAVLALLFAIIGAYYYLRIVMVMYFEEPVRVANSKIVLPAGVTGALTINGLAALGLGLLPSGLIDLCRISLG